MARYTMTSGHMAEPIIRILELDHGADRARYHFAAGAHLAANSSINPHRESIDSAVCASCIVCLRDVPNWSSALSATTMTVATVSPELKIGRSRAGACAAFGARRKYQGNRAPDSSLPVES